MRREQLLVNAQVEVNRAVIGMNAMIDPELQKQVECSDKWNIHICRGIRHEDH